MDAILEKFNPWWNDTYEFPGIERKAYLDKLSNMVDIRDVIFITGLRRVGKTTLMHQCIHRLLQREAPERILYISLDYFPLKEYSILEIEDAYRQLHSLKYNDKVYLFLDEVHFQDNFEIQLKNLYDLGFSKVFASGSGNLDIIMRSPYLTGRQRLITVNPLSFKEFIEFRGVTFLKANQHLYPTLAADYVENGGLPEYVITKDPNVLQSLIDTILYRDISDRHDIRNRENVKNILRLIAQSVSTSISVNRISRLLKIRNEVVSKIINLFIEANLIHIVERTGKFTERKISPKKMYLADTGLFSVLTERINLGAKVENCVFLTLAKAGTVRYSNIGQREVDFIHGNSAFESKYKHEISQKDLSAILHVSGMDSKTVVTESKEGNTTGVNLVPLWRFLLDQN